MQDIRNKISDANKEFYNIVSSNYEKLDGRRSIKLHNWLHDTIANILKNNENNNESLLDALCGAGFVLKSIRTLFDKTYGIDISEEMINIASEYCDKAEVRDVYNTGYANSTFTFITCFAGLHHLASLEDFFTEMYKILKPGGIFYSDHDMEAHFYKNYKWLILLYRKIGGSEKHYEKVKGLNKKIYKLTEYNEKGIDSDTLKKLLLKIGFSKVTIKYHWYGLNKIGDLIFGKKTYKKGKAPLLQIIAEK